MECYGTACFMCTAEGSLSLRCTYLPRPMQPSPRKTRPPWDVVCDPRLRRASRYVKRSGEGVEGLSNRASKCDGSRAATVTANAEYREASETSAGAAYESQSQETITSQDDTNGIVQDDTDTSLDQLAFDYNQSRKCPKSRQSRSRKRAGTSSYPPASACADYAAHFAHTSLQPVKAYVDRPALCDWIREQLDRASSEGRREGTRTLAVFDIALKPCVLKPGSWHQTG
ncbi:hypothetical protein BU26DRAFT_511238 [Trematosphaeria pertusa]|uniref:Uncharacterized protein n=1 Tax=Trematosphaeria pertusa TaxID=390896 RepID=A0A6A6HUR4_9PLEO|nr:uncharacterized protein BU26DRAFT_511238 [Trematosphaeria pertusa]KAF2241846.1 hypothetical protein BU26DRAFT_511238 [Trematosphaeria pertusa]